MANIFTRVLNALRKKEREPVSSFINLSRYGTSSKPSMTLAAAYRCVSVISDSVAQLPLDTFRRDNEGFKSLYTSHPAYTLLREFPSPDMTRFTFLKTLVSSVLLNGNGYAYIDRDEYGNALSLQFIPANLVTIVYINVDGMERRRYKVTGFKYLVEPTDMIHVLNFSYDSISNIKDAIIILKNNKLGLVGWNGELIIEPSYNCIEFVNMHDEVYTDVFRDSCYKQYGKYRPDFIFDTDENITEAENSSGEFLSEQTELLEVINNEEASENDDSLSSESNNAEITENCLSR